MNVDIRITPAGITLITGDESVDIAGDSAALMELFALDNDRPRDMTDGQLLTRVMLLDLLAAYENTYDESRRYEGEVTRRFGADALENSAQHFTGWHYSSEDILLTAVEQPAWLARLMRNGSRDCCASVIGDPHRDHCSHKNDPPRPHGERVRHHVTGDLGTVVGRRDDGTVGVVWDDDTTSVDSVQPDTIVTAP